MFFLGMETLEAYMRKHDYGHMATKPLRDNSFPCGLQDP